MDKLPLVSVGVPTYNRPRTLRRTLDSLVNQTYENLEIIVSDNCSTDSDVLNVINEFQDDPRIMFVVHPVNGGLSFNFNFLSAKATGEYFMWLADDDWLDINYIESCVRFLLAHSNYSGAYGLAKMYTPQAEFLWFDAKINMEQELGTARVTYYLQNVVNNGCFSALIPKKYINELVLDNKIAIDWMIISRLAMYGKYKMLENVNCHISGGGASATTESLVSNFNMPLFTRSFPYLSIALNVARDILWDSPAYNKLQFLGRIRLAKECFILICKRHNIKRELKPGIKNYIVHLKSNTKALAKKILKRNRLAYKQ